MSFSVYILWSRTLGKYYIGHTPDLVEQLLQHNGGKSQETRPGIPWKLMYHEEFANISDAVTRVEEIRTRKSRTYIEQLIDR